MAEKISLYGLSRSGKSCFIYAMSQALSQGIELADGEIMNVITPDPRQMLRLYNAYDGMINGSWPKGTDKSFVYNFNVLKSLALLTTIDVEDYRGGLLQDLDEDAQEEQNELYNSFNQSSVLLFFIGADVIKAKNTPQAILNFGQFASMYTKYLNESNNGAQTPVMVVITKADLLTQQELAQAYETVKDKWRFLFGRGTNLTTGITAVSLGKNLTNEGGVLEGELDIRATAGNLSIPIMFSLYHVMGQKIEASVGKISETESSLNRANGQLNHELSRSSFARFFINKETSIRNQIDAHKANLGRETEILQKLNSSMAAIKEFLLSGAQIYINGERV